MHGTRSAETNIYFSGAHVKSRANGFNICFNISSILLNAIERLLNDVERRDGKRFQHLIQQNFASGLEVSSRL